MMSSPIVMFGEDWGGLPSSTQHLARRFAETRRVIWVNSIGMRRPRVSLKDGRRVVRKLARMMRPRSKQPTVPTTPVPETLTIINPRAVSWPGNPLAAMLNRRLLGDQIREVLSEHGLVRPVLWTSLPTAVDVVGELGESAVVYYCCDDFSSLEGVDHRPVSRLERRLVDEAGLVFTTNDALAEKLAARRHVSLPHGVDAELFMTPAERPADMPSGKVAMFYGSLAPWIDVPALAALAEARPDWQLVLIGAAQTDISALQGHANVHLLGPRPHSALPGYVQHADAALLPFRDTPQIRACNPLKLREYLASGTPVLSTDFPALAPYRHLVDATPGVEDFSSALDRLDATEPAARRRQESVRGETWDARARTALAAIVEIAP